MASRMAADGSGPANSLTTTLRTKSRNDPMRPSCPYGARWRAPRRLGILTGSRTALSALGLNSAPVVSKLPGRVDRPGTKSLGFDAPLTWQVLQLIPAWRATPPRMAGELNARLPRLIR